MEEMKIPEHIAIIMDGNRRWAKENGLSTPQGHKKGAETLEKITKHCNKLGVKYLTVYAFSTENWQRTREEVGALMFLFDKFVEKYLVAATENMKLRIIGDLDDETVPKSLAKKMRKLMEQTKDNTGLELNVAFNYGGKKEIVKATKEIAEEVKNGTLDINDIDEEVFANHLYTKGESDPDLVIRTSGEMRTSNFLPWQITYSEFIFLDKYWPDFSCEDVDNCIAEYNNRNRRKGK